MLLLVPPVAPFSPFPRSLLPRRPSCPPFLSARSACLPRLPPTGAPSWPISRKGGLTRLITSPTPTPHSVTFYRRSPIDASPRRGPCHASLHRHAYLPRQRPRRIRSSPTGLPHLVHSPEGALTTPPHIATPPYLSNARAASSRLLPAHLVGASLQRGACHSSPHRHTYAVSGHLLPVQLGSAPPGRALVTPSYFGNTHAASSRLLPARPVGASPGRVLATPPSIGTPLSPPAVP